MNKARELIIIRELLMMSQEDIAKELGVSFETINRWENETVGMTPSQIEKISEYAYRKKLNLNRLYEEIYKAEFETQNKRILYHGSKKNIEYPLDLNHSKKNNDFGTGFYMSESYEQAVSYISGFDKNEIHVLQLETSGLKIERFNLDREWMLAVAYYRGWLENYAETETIKEIKNKVDNADLIIAPIADNRMFDILFEFTKGLINDNQCLYSLAATDLGNQYVVKSELGIKQLRVINELYFCGLEKENVSKRKIEINQRGFDESVRIRSMYRKDGKYIEEIFK